MTFIVPYLEIQNHHKHHTYLLCRLRAQHRPDAAGKVSL
jgi:hypothetical protein